MDQAQENVESALIVVMKGVSRIGCNILGACWRRHCGCRWRVSNWFFSDSGAVPAYERELAYKYPFDEISLQFKTVTAF